MRVFFACLLMSAIGLAACSEQAPVEQAPEPQKRKWNYERFEDAIRGSTFVTATIDANASDRGAPATQLVIRTAADGNEIWVIDNFSLIPCMSGYVLVKIGDDPEDLVSCSGRRANLDPAMIPRIQRARRVVVEFGTMDPKRPLQVTFETADLQL